MRNPNRIPEILRLVAKVWYKSPDLRLGQLLLNATRDEHTFYYIEDEDLIEVLKKTYKEE
jgi:uncharacterized protein YihD (DUF1040 family)